MHLNFLVLKGWALTQQATNVAGRITCTVRARLEKTKVVMSASTYAFLENCTPNYLKETTRNGLIQPRR
jgi:hypothetical protein